MTDPDGTGQPTLRREHVWGPGDNGFDELLIQFDGPDWETRNIGWWSLHDASGDLVGLFDLDSNNEARLVAQWSYEPYGDVIAAEHLHPFPVQTLGHKGLFLDRLDNETNAPSSSGDSAHRLVPFAHSIYHNRNRVYAPSLGRFLQQDPNQTAMGLLEGGYHDSSMGAAALAYSLEGLYGDGQNLYQYLGSSPVSRFDPMGLSWDPFDMVDDYIAADIGARAAFLSQMGQDAKALAVVAATIASYLPFPGAGFAGDLALLALGESSGGEFAAGIALGIIPGGKLLGGLGKIVGNIGSSAWRTAKHYASQYGSPLFKAATYSPAGHLLKGLANRAGTFLKKGCGCFVAGTMVWTADGQVPIEQLQIGDQVVAFNEATGEREFRLIIDTYIREGAPIVEVTVESQAGMQTLRTTEEHPFYIVGRGWVDAGHLTTGDVATIGDGPSRILGVHFTADLETVYNLEVEGLHNYFVSNDGVLVHNGNGCPLGTLSYRNFRSNLKKLMPPPGKTMRPTILYRIISRTNFQI